MRLLEATICFSIAMGIHAGFWLATPAETETASSGASGNMQVTVLAATPQQVAMVARWQTPPAVSHSAPRLPASPASAFTVAPPAQMPTHGLSPFREDVAHPIKRAGLIEPAAMQMPRIDQTTAPAPASAKIAPLERQRPKARPETFAKHADPATAQLQQRATGRAKTTQKGENGQNQTQSNNSNNAFALRAKWGAEIHAKVQRNMRYPRGARGSGTAKLALKIAPNGSLKGLSLLKSSGNDLLDKAAIKAVHTAGRFAKAPAELSEAAYAFSLSLTFNR